MQRPGEVAPPKPAPNPALERGLAILELLSGDGRARGVSEIARDLGLAKSSCHGLLETLERAGYAARGTGDTWSPTLRMHLVGLRVAMRGGVLREAQPALDALRDQTGLSCHLGVRDGAAIVYAAKAAPFGIVQFDTGPGKRGSLHLTAIGQVFAAWMKRSELDDALDASPLGGGTARAALTREEFDRRLAEVRATGFAFEDEQEMEGVRCIAAPVFERPGTVVAAAIGVTGLASQIADSQVTDLSTLVMATASDVSARLSPLSS
jgi:DNA-binding IclR family transcriptional regulator